MAEKVDELVPKFPSPGQNSAGVTAMTFWRRDLKPEQGWPAKIKTRRRDSRSRQQLEAYKAKLLSEALKR